MNRTVVVVVVIVMTAMMSVSSARAQVFSPGPLAKAHAELEGMGNCKRCHGDGSQHDNGRCLECHTEIARRKDKGEGYHGRLGAQTCAECHRDHRGVGAKLIEWPAGQRGFNHALTTWPLVGAHKKTDCRACHEPRRLQDQDAITLQQKQGRDLPRPVDEVRRLPLRRAPQRQSRRSAGDRMRALPYARRVQTDATL